MQLREVVSRSVAFRKRLMRLTVVSVATMAAWGLVGQGTALGQDDKQEATFRAKALEGHNAKRATLMNTPALTLADATDPLNTGARDWALTMASTANFDHDPNNTKYGENIYVDYTTGNEAPDALATNAVNSWWSEKANYDYSNPGVQKNKDLVFGHFTQVAWVSTTRLGCGYATGPATIDGMSYNAFYAVCRYDPPGNVSGQYGDNVQPPQPGKIASLFPFSPKGTRGPKQTLTLALLPKQ